MDEDVQAQHTKYPRTWGTGRVQNAWGCKLPRQVLGPGSASSVTCSGQYWGGCRRRGTSGPNPTCTIAWAHARVRIRVLDCRSTPVFVGVLRLSFPLRQTGILRTRDGPGVLYISNIALPVATRGERARTCRTPCPDLRVVVSMCVRRARGACGCHTRTLAPAGTTYTRIQSPSSTRPHHHAIHDPRPLTAPRVFGHRDHGPRGKHDQIDRYHRQRRISELILVPEGRDAVTAQLPMGGCAGQEGERLVPVLVWD